ncbi:hypothetical protein V565_325720, partial [Rhizoctonia solani 123E]
GKRRHEFTLEMVPRTRRSPRQRGSLANRVGTHSSTPLHSSFPRRLPSSRKPVQVQIGRKSREQETSRGTLGFRRRRHQVCASIPKPLSATLPRPLPGVY